MKVLAASERMKEIYSIVDPFMATPNVTWEEMKEFRNSLSSDASH